VIWPKFCCKSQKAKLLIKLTNNYTVCADFLKLDIGYFLSGSLEKQKHPGRFNHIIRAANAE
jgi:hypothetical protein